MLKMVSVLIAVGALTIAGCASTGTPGVFESPSATAVPVTKKAIRLLVIGEGFTSENDFAAHEQDASKAFDLLTAGLHVNAEIIPTMHFLRASMAGDTTLPGFAFNGDPVLCYFNYDVTTLSAIYKIGASLGTFDRYLVVYHAKTAPKKYPGCAVDDVMFVGDKAFPKTMAHEMGHAMAGLYDENGAASKDSQFCLKWRNCATSRTDLPWTPNGQTGPDNGCDGFVDLFHPTTKCRMIQAQDVRFCHVCQDYIGEALNGSLVPAPRPKEGKGCDDAPLIPRFWPTRAMVAKGGTEIVAVIGRTSDEIVVLDLKPSTERRLQPQWITGDVFAVAEDGAGIVGIQPIAADREASLMGRAYGVEADDKNEAHVSELRVDVPAQLVRITLPGIVPSEVEGRHLKLRLRYLPNARRFGVVDEAIVGQLAGLPVAGVIYDLQQAIEAMPD